MKEESNKKEPTIYVVPTPIGNLEDITLRAINTLKAVEVIFAEDTRTTSILLKHYEINKKLISNHLYNEEKMTNKIIEYLKEGKSVAIVSDAGTPVISDPGYIVINEAIKQGYNVTCLPGPTAIIPAVVMSGLAGGPFTFYGFLNSKESKRKKELEKLQNDKYPIVFYEAPHRLEKTIYNLKEIFGNREVAIIREISKKYEETIRGNLESIIEKIENIKGEIVIVVEGNKEHEKYDAISIKEHLNLYLKEGILPKEAIKIVSKERNIQKSEVYNEYIKTKDEKID